jgi:putative DNA primase/helicase
LSRSPSHPVVALADLQLRATYFVSERATKPIPWSGSALELVGRHQLRARKKGMRAFSAAVYRDGAARSNAGVEAITALVLDFDHLSSEAAEGVHQKMKRWAHIAYSSFRHRLDGDEDCCFRVVLFVSRPILPAEFDRVWTFADAELGRLADRDARDLARIWFLPSCPRERAKFARISRGDGVLLDVDAILAEAPAPEPPRAAEPPEPASKTAGPVDEGSRNAHLLSLAGSMRRKGLGEEAIRAALLEENQGRCQPALTEHEVAGIARSVARYSPGSPMLTRNRTDLGNAERLKDHAGADLRFVWVWDSWMVWDGRRWKRDTGGEILRRARDTVRALAAVAEGIDNEKQRAALIKHALKTESAGKLQAMVKLGACLLGEEAEAFDQRRWLLNCGNGTIDLRTGRLGPHRRHDLLTKLVTVDYDPAATCPRWEAFLLQVMDGSAEMVTFLQRAVGYSLTGATVEQVLFLLYGTGANGKSTFTETLRALLGDYATQAEFTTFLARTSDSVRNDIARLVGARFVSASEAEGGRPLAEAVVKQMTGGDIVTARFLFKEFFEFRPDFKVWLAANHKPSVRGTDHGIWRRIRLVPFAVTIPPEERDKGLPDQLGTELPGILAWAVRGCLAWRKEGLGVPPAVLAATESYREEMDVLAGFLDEHCVAQAAAFVPTKELYAAYSKWAEGAGEKKLSKKWLAMRLAERGFTSGRGLRGVRGWRGLRLRREGEPVQAAGSAAEEGAPAASLDETAQLEAFEERAAIAEYSGGLGRDEAEQLARRREASDEED